jgi:hypothetical protein
LSQERPESMPEIALVNSRYSRQKSLTTFSERPKKKSPRAGIPK